MSEPSSNNLYYVAYPPDNLWAYDYQQFPPHPTENLAEPFLNFNSFNAAPQPFPMSDNNLPTIASESYPSEDHPAQIVENSDSGYDILPLFIDLSHISVAIITWVPKKSSTQKAISPALTRISTPAVLAGLSGLSRTTLLLLGSFV